MVIFSGLASVFTAIGVSATVAGYLANTLVTVGLNLLGARLNKPKKRTRTAIESEIEIGEDRPVSAVYGRAPVEGHWVYYNRFGPGDRVNQFVYVLANGWCDGLDTWINIAGEKKDLVPVPVKGNEVARYHVQDWPSIVIRFFDGRPGQKADEELVKHANPRTAWDRSSKLTGLCYVSVDHTFDANLYSAGGIPKIKYNLRGLRLYEWRKDSTIAGGNGNHRINDPATWEFSENPAVQRFNFELGLKGLASNSNILGMGKSAAALDLASYTFSANACDRTRTVDGKKIAAYICGTRVFADDQYAEILDRFDDAMSGYGVERNGLSGVIAGAPQVPAMRLGPEHLRTDGGFVSQPRRSRTDRINRLSGGFPDPEQLWELVPYETVQDDDALTIDKMPLNSQLDLPQIPSAPHAQYVAENRFRQNRRMHQISGLPISRRAAIKLHSGDWVEWEDNTWLVMQVGFDKDSVPFLDLAETAAEIYDENARLQPVQASSLAAAPEGGLQSMITGLTIQQTLIEGQG